MNFFTFALAPHQAAWPGVGCRCEGEPVAEPLEEVERSLDYAACGSATFSYRIGSGGLAFARVAQPSVCPGALYRPRCGARTSLAVLAGWLFGASAARCWLALSVRSS